MAAYGEHPDPGRTPVLDALAAEGVLFRHAWTNPVCSATRASILTGRYAFRTGIGSFLGYQDFTDLRDDELSLADILPAGYATAAVGKWHLASVHDDPARHPLRLGFDHHRGSLTNFPDHDPTAYFSWPKNVDGVVGPCSTYATTDTVDEALALIAQFGAPPEPRPWFLWVAFNAPHKPYHAPPAHLHSYDLPPLGSDDPLYMRALTEAMDTEIGRLLTGLDPAVRANTLIVFVGDNGTAQSATTAPFVPAHAKGSTYEGGVNVPLIIAGPGVVAGGECTALVNTTDLFATVAGFVGVPSPAEDSVSLAPYLADPSAAPLRAWVYTEWFQPDLAELASTHRRAVRDARFKLRRGDTLTTVQYEQLFDLAVDPFEQHDLLRAGNLGPAALAARDQLRAVLASLYRTTLVPDLDLIAVLPTDAVGGFSLDHAWPPGLPAGLALYFQAWPLDATAPEGVSASNALLAVTP